MKQHNLDCYGISDIGVKRKNNEDIIAYLLDHNFFAIADGMGGHKAGEIAAKQATDDICNYVKNILHPNTDALSPKEIHNHIETAIIQANKKVFMLGKKYSHYKGMGTTLCCIYFHKNITIYAHVGDSRIYLLRDNELKQLTDDHSLVRKLNLEAKSKKAISFKNIITKAIGTELILQPSISFEYIYPNDLYLLCSDGLSDFIEHHDILDILKSSKSKKTVTKNLVETAKKNGSNDNISALLVEVQ